MRKLVCFAAPFALAAAVCCYLLPPAAPLWLGLACALVALPFLFFRGDVRTRGLLLALGAAAGFFWFRGWTALFAAPAQALAGTTAAAEARVLDYPAPTSRGVSVDVKLSGAGMVRLYAGPECAELEPGDLISFTAGFRSADRLYGEETTYYAARGVFLLAYADDGGVEITRKGTPFWLLPKVWAHALGGGLDRAFPPELAAFLRGVTLGDKSALAGSTVTAFNRAGLSHLLVVSGLHVSLLLWGLKRLLRRHKRWVLPIALPALALFVLLVGCTPSALRAALMSALVLLAPTAKREADAPTSLAAALLLLLIQNPYAAASVSLQLSFASVAGLLLFADPMEGWLRGRTIRPAKTRRDKWRSRLLGWLWSNLAMTLGAMAFTTPLIALWFRSASLAAPLANLLCLWAGKYIFLGGLVCGLLALAWPLGACVLALPVGLLCRYVLWVVKGLGALPFAALSLNTVYYRLWLLGVYALGGSFFLFRRSPKRLVLPLCCPVVLLCAAIFFTSRTFTAAPLTVTALDVGQGSATAFCSQGVTALVDCGGNAADSAGDIAADYFQSLGLSRLDLLVFTHLDGDHFNGAEELFARMEVEAVALPDCEDVYGRRTELEALARAEGAQVWYVTQPLDAELGACTLTLWPPLGRGTTNEEGLFALCSAGDFDVLVTGDADAAVEAMLVKYYDIPDIELLVVGHHGSNGSTSADFLAAVRPEYAVISSGYNTYGHPNPAVLDRLDRAGAEIYRTDLQGSVTFAVSDAGRASVE